MGHTLKPRVQKRRYANPMNGLLPLLLLGGAVVVAMQGPSATPGAQTTTTALPPVSDDGLGGYIQAVHAEMLRQLPMAHQGYLAALANDPDNPMLRQRSLSLALAANDFETATRLAKSLPVAEQPAIAQLALLVDAIKAGQLDEADRLLVRLQKLGPNLPVVHVLQAQVAAAEGTPVAKLLPLLATHGWVGQWHGARLALQSNDTPAAELLIRQAIRTNPGAYPAVQLALMVLPAAEHATILHHFAEANPSLAPALQRAPTPIAMGTPREALRGNVAAALQGFALELWVEGAPGAALQLSVLAQQAGPDAQLGRFLPYAYTLVQQAANQGDVAAAYRALAQDAQFGVLARMRLNELEYLNATTDAERAAMAKRAWALAKANPRFAVLWQSAAQLNLASGQFLRAAEASSAMLPLLPQTPSGTLPLREADVYFARGAAYAQAGKTAQAEADLKAAIARNPAHAEALNYLGYMWVDANVNLAQAYDMLKTAQLLAPQSAAITDSVGWAYYRKGDYATARDYLEKALELDPDLPEIMSHLADTYAKLGQQAEAAKLWRRALQLADDGAEVPSQAFHDELRAKVRALPR